MPGLFKSLRHLVCLDPLWGSRIFMSAMGVYGYLWLPGCLWVSMSVCICDYGYMSVYGCLWVTMSVYIGDYSWVRSPWATMSRPWATHGCLWAIMVI